MHKQTKKRTVKDQINAVIDGIGDPPFILDKNQVIIKVNKATCEILKKTQRTYLENTAMK